MVKDKKDNLLDKSLKVIQSFLDVNNSWGVRELSNYLGYSVPTTHRILQQLKNHYILDFDEERQKYIIGNELIRLGSKVSINSDVTKIAKPFLEKLSFKYKENICLLLLRKNEFKILWAYKQSGTQPLQYRIPIGELQAIPYGSSGKSILAHLDKEYVDYVLDKEEFSETEKEELLHQLTEINRMGYGYSISERLEGSSGIASAIFNADNEPIGSILLTAPSPRVTEDVIENASADIKEAVIEISRTLGSSKL